MRPLFTLLLLCAGAAAFCQQDAMKAVKADETINDVFTVKDLFHYPQFTNGKVIFRDGNAAEARLNYHKLFEQMMFIDDKGDSLAIASPETIALIVMGKDSFYYGKGGYMLLSATCGSIRLAKKQVLSEYDQQKNGAYGSTYTNNATTSNRYSYTVDGKPRLNVGESTLFSQKSLYFISYKQNEFVPVTKKGIEKMFDGHSKEIKEWVKEKNTDFSREKDLKELLTYIQSL